MEESSCELSVDAAIGLTEMMHLKEMQQKPVDGEKRPCLCRHVLPTSSSICTHDDDNCAAHIKVGSYYEINHSKLSPKSPDQLKSVRVVMVREKSKVSVSLRFPSLYSLRAHFNNGNPNMPEGKSLPTLDEKYVMGLELAGEALYRRIPPHEIAVQRNLWNFWVVPSIVLEKERLFSLPIGNSGLSKSLSAKGSCWSELNCRGMVKWGQRRQVRFLGRHDEERSDQVLSNNVEGEEKKEEKGKEKRDEEKEGEGEEYEEEEEKEEEQEQEDEEEQVEEMEVGSEEDVKVKQSGEPKKNLKTKCLAPRRRNKRARRNTQYQMKVYNQSKKKQLKNSIDRWSVERYKLAEENMLKILKEKGAVFGNPILRPALRSEARRLIGDTGLLDHLLKHMSGKVAPGGKERFRRRHNADGAMEYWLESADLVNIRWEAGVQDPYWTPPPGWKPGDNPTQDPVCAGEIKKLKEEMEKLKRDMQEMISKKHEENQVTVTLPNSCGAIQTFDDASSSLSPKEMYVELVNKKAKIEEQLMEISQSLCGMEEETRKLKSTIEESDKLKSAAIPLQSMGSTTLSYTERERKEVNQNSEEAKSMLEEEQIDDEKAKGKAPTPSKPNAEDKAAKIERLKSGFKICKPPGTFLWPNMAASPEVEVVVHLEDVIAVPTPPSVSSSTTSASHLLPLPPQYGLHPGSPVKPLAEKRTVTINLPTVVTEAPPLPPPPPPLPLEPTTDRTSLINLNEVPSNLTDNGFCGPHTQSSPSPFSSHRRPHSETSNVTQPRLVRAKKEDARQWEGGERRELLRNCEQQRGCPFSSPSSSLSVGERTWLALASNFPLDNNSKRG